MRHVRSSLYLHQTETAQLSTALEYIPNIFTHRLHLQEATITNAKEEATRYQGIWWRGYECLTGG